MQLSVLACFLIALWYWFVNMDLGSLGRALGNCAFNGVLFGIIFGDVVKGTIIGATINIMYISVAAVGANMPADDSMAACIAIPVALATGLSPEEAVLLATPFGILGTFMDNIRRMINGYWNRKMNKDIDKLNFKGFLVNGLIGPLAVQFLVRVPITFAIVLGVARGTASILEIIPAWVMTGLSTLGGVLPGFGLVLCCTFIGKKDLLPFFVLGFFIFKAFGITNTVVAGILGFVIAYVFVKLSYRDDDEQMDFSMFKSTEWTGKMSKSESSRTGLRVILLHRFANSMEALYGTGVCWSLTPILRKIYGDNEEGLKEALHRHNLPYISEMCGGNCIIGAALAMEEEIAAGNAEVTGDDVVTLKSSLMGPFAGFGDSLLYSTFAPLFRTIFIPLAQAGSVFAGVFMEWAIRIICTIIGVWSFNLGYSTGKKSLLTILKGKTFKKLMLGAAVMGMFMLGVMGASYCKLNIAYEVYSETLGGAISLQSKLDSILPGMLPFILMLSVYRYFEKGGQYIKLILVCLVVALAGAFVGIF